MTLESQTAPDQTTHSPQPAEAPVTAASEADDVAGFNAATLERMRRLPPEVGAVLVTVGIVGVIVPGPVGMPLLLAGGLALMPSVFGKAERWMSRRFPKFHKESMRGINRFMDDFEKRFPEPAQTE
jgi:hypothetical protein